MSWYSKVGLRKPRGIKVTLASSKYVLCPDQASTPAHVAWLHQLNLPE